MTTMTDAGLITPLSGLPIFVQLMMAAASLVLGVYCLRAVFSAPSNYNDDGLFIDILAAIGCICGGLFLGALALSAPT